MNELSKLIDEAHQPAWDGIRKQGQLLIKLEEAMDNGKETSKLVKEMHAVYKTTADSLIKTGQLLKKSQSELSPEDYNTVVNESIGDILHVKAIIAYSEQPIETNLELILDIILKRGEAARAPALDGRHRINRLKAN